MRGSRLVGTGVGELVGIGIGELVGTGVGELDEEGAGKLVGAAGRDPVGAGVGELVDEGAGRLVGAAGHDLIACTPTSETRGKHFVNGPSSVAIGSVVLTALTGRLGCSPCCSRIAKGAAAGTNGIQPMLHSDLPWEPQLVSM